MTEIIGTEGAMETDAAALTMEDRVGVEPASEYFYGRYVFIIAREWRKGACLGVHEEAALRVTGCISVGVIGSDEFMAIVNPRHLSVLAGDETMPGVRRVVTLRSEIEEARRALREAGLEILGEYGEHQ
jgi:hypothetical protein